MTVVAPAGTEPVNLLRVKLVYLVLFGFFGAVSPLLTLLYREDGLSSAQIGSLSVISPIVSFVVTPTLCALADRLQIHKRMLLSCIALSAATQCLVLGPRTFAWQGSVRLAVSILGAPVGSLLDAAVLTSLQGSSATYGAQRAWGAVGFGIMTLVSGTVVDSPLGWRGVFATYLLLAAASLAACAPFRIDSRAPGSKRPKVGAALRSMLLGRPETAAIFGTVVLSGMASGIIDTFLFVYLWDLGGRGSVMGVARFIMCSAEVPLFYVSGRLIAWAGVKRVIAMAQAAYVVRFMYYSLLRNPWWVLPSEVLHGVTFGLMWSATTAYAHSVAPPGASSTAQGIVSGLHWGLGFGTGAIGGGYVYQHVGPVRTFELGACLSTVSLALITSACLLGSNDRAPAPAATAATDTGGSVELAVHGKSPATAPHAHADEDALLLSAEQEEEGEGAAEHDALMARHRDTPGLVQRTPPRRAAASVSPASPAGLRHVRVHSQARPAAAVAAAAGEAVS